MTRWLASQPLTLALHHTSRALEVCFGIDFFSRRGCLLALTLHCGSACRQRGLVYFYSRWRALVRHNMSALLLYFQDDSPSCPK